VILVAKVESCIAPNFGETLNREAIDDSDNLSRATEVAMSLACGGEVPQISTRKPRLLPSEFLTLSAKRVLQQNPGNSGHGTFHNNGSANVGCSSKAKMSALSKVEMSVSAPF
jgi:hypothetical protein